MDNIGTVEMSSDVVQDILTKVHREKNITVLNMRGVVMSSDFVFGKKIPKQIVLPGKFQTKLSPNTLVAKVK